MNQSPAKKSWTSLFNEHSFRRLHLSETPPQPLTQFLTRLDRKQ